MIASYLQSSLIPIVVAIVYILTGFFSLFLFFRAGKHELADDEILFDSTLIAIIGVLVFGRLVDFFTRYDFYNFSIKKLIFFNVFFGFDWYGALLGAAVLSGFYLRRKKQKILAIFDLAAAPIVFGAMGIFLIDYLFFGKLTSIFYFALLLIVFWILKRLAKVKRFDGFFTSITLTLAGVLNLIFFWQKGNFVFGNISYSLLMPLVAIILGIILFYKFSKRNIRADLKNIVGFVLLGLFKLKRILFSFSEANLVARSILLSPYYLVKLVIHLVKLLGREIYLSVVDLMRIWGVLK